MIYIITNSNEQTCKKYLISKHEQKKLQKQHYQRNKNSVQ